MPFDIAEAQNDSSSWLHPHRYGSRWAKHEALWSINMAIKKTLTITYKSVATTQTGSQVAAPKPRNKCSQPHCSDHNSRRCTSVHALGVFVLVCGLIKLWPVQSFVAWPGRAAVARTGELWPPAELFISACVYMWVFICAHIHTDAYWHIFIATMCHSFIWLNDRMLYV